MKRLLWSLAALPLLTGAAFAAPPTAGSSTGAGYVDQLEIKGRYDAYNGQYFGYVGPYEVVYGIVHGKLDPRNPSNAGIVDLTLAPKDSQGMVDYSEDFVILRPKFLGHAKRVLWYEVVNRGNILDLSTFNGASAVLGPTATPGNALLLQNGYTLVWSGWQGDVPQTGHGDTLSVGTAFPFATNNGLTITGQSREEFVLDTLGLTPDSNGYVTAPITYLPADINSTSNVIFNWRQTWRTSTDPLTEGMTFTAPSSPVTNWSYANNGAAVTFQMPTGSDVGSIFEFVYTAKNPTVMGIGFAAIRDFVSFLNLDKTDHQGATANPLSDLKQAPCDSGHCDPSRNFDVTIMEGISQSGRFTRDFLWHGFNDDARRSGYGGDHVDHQVFNGMFPIIAGSRKTFTDFRWGQPGRWSKQHEDHWQPGDQFPFTYSVIRDPVSGVTDGILAKCEQSDTCPKIIHLDGGFEIFGARGSLLVTDGAGHPVTTPDNVRLYEVPGTSHGGGGGVDAITQSPICIYPGSPVVESTIDRALAPVLVDWVAKGIAPPDSRYPSLTDNTLAPPTDQADIGFPNLSLAGYPFYGYLYNPIVVTNYSNAVPVADLAEAYKVFIAKTDSDGNEVSGVRVPDVVTPLATYADWNVRAPGHAAGDACYYQASMLYFAETRNDRLKDQDPRLSLQERYGTKANYVAKVKAAAESLVAQRLLLPDDVSVYVNAAQAQTIFP